MWPGNTATSCPKTLGSPAGAMSSGATVAAVVLRDTGSAAPPRAGVAGNFAAMAIVAFSAITRWATTLVSLFVLMRPLSHWPTQVALNRADEGDCETGRVVGLHHLRALPQDQRHVLRKHAQHDPTHLLREAALLAEVIHLRNYILRERVGTSIVAVLLRGTGPPTPSGAAPPEFCTAAALDSRRSGGLLLSHLGLAALGASIGPLQLHTAPQRPGAAPLPARGVLSAPRCIAADHRGSTIASSGLSCATPIGRSTPDLTPSSISEVL
mmetsp:Transcript_36602/g.80180  ORF Transcript_36602/g.80180 Transcript_36602/m.80180 type:complete len:268 (-) Transcript_36602:797-1600(-)